MAGFSANAIAAIPPISMSSFEKYRAIGTQLTMTRFAATEQRPLRDRMRLIGCLTSGALTAMLLAGCGLSTVPQPVPGVPSQTRGLRAAPAWVIDRMTRVAPDLYFNFDSYALSKPEQRKLTQIALGLEDLLHDFPDLIIVVEGHCDDRGLAEYNEQLGLERADAVKRALLNLGFPDDCLRAVSFSDRAPLCPTPDDRCGQKNRRVHFRAAQPAASVHDRNAVEGGGKT